MIAGTLEIQMVANMARLAKDMSDAKATVERSMGGIDAAIAKTKTALAGLGLGLSAGFFVNLITSSIAAQEHLNDLTHVTSMTVEEMAGLKLVADQSSTTIENLAQAIGRMSVNMGKEPERFRALGVTAKDSLGAFKQLADIFNMLPDIQQRNALAQAVFNRSWQEIAPTLSLGSKGIQEVVDRGKALSGVTNESAKNADLYRDQMAELNLILGSTRNKLIGDMLPAMVRITAAMQEAAKEGGLLKTVWIGLGGVAAELFGATDEAKAAKRLKEINAQLVITRAQLEAGTLNPDKTAGFWSFLIGNPKLNDEAIASFKKTVAALEAEREKLMPKATMPAAVKDDTFEREAAAARAKAFLDEANAYAARVVAIRAHTQQYTDAIKVQGTLTQLAWKTAGIDNLRTQEDLMRQESRLRDMDLKNQIADQQKLRDLAVKKGDQKDEAAAIAAIARAEQQRVDNTRVTEAQIRALRTETAQRQAQERAAWEEGQINQGSVLADTLRDQSKIEDEAYEKRKTSLAMYLASAQGMIADDNALQQNLKAQHEYRLFIIERDKNEAVRSMQIQTWQMAVELLQTFAGKSREAAIAVIVINKALAIAQVVINTQVAVMRAYAEMGPYAGSAMAAYLEGLQAVQIALIVATGLGQISQVGKGGAAPGSVSNPSSTVASQSSQNVDQSASQLAAQSSTHTTIVHFNASDDDVFSGRMMRKFLTNLEEATRDGGRVIIAGGTGQP